MNDLLGKTIENPIIGDIVTYVHTANETNGEKTVLELKLFPGGGNGLHFHTAFDESFELIEGSLNVQVGNRKTKMAVGDKITAGKNEPYRFFADSDKSGTFKITLVPGHAGFEKCISDWLWLSKRRGNKQERDTKVQILTRVGHFVGYQYARNIQYVRKVFCTKSE